MNTILSEDCVYNILGHIKNCWDYTYPTGKALETAIYRGLKPFFPDAKELGSTITIVDCAKEKDAFDIKGSKNIGHLSKVTKNSNSDKNIFAKVNVPNKGNYVVRIPKTIDTMVRRPKVDLQSYKGDPEQILSEQVNEYYEFAFSTTKSSGYEKLYTVTLQYGVDEKKGLKSIFLSISEFSQPEITNYRIEYKKDQKTPCGYGGYNDKDECVFRLSSFNKGSSNLNKLFHIQNGYLLTWPLEDQNDVVFSKDMLEKFAAFNRVD